MQRIHLSRAGSNDSRGGATTVEMALAAPILLTFVFGIIQVGYAFMVQHSIQSAAYKGCRAGILPNRSTSTVTSVVSGMLQPVGLSDNATTTIQVNNVTANVATAVSGDEVSVIVAIPLPAVTLFPGFFSNWTGNLTGAATIRCQ